MKQPVPLFVLAALALFLTAYPAAQPPVTDPTTFPVSEVSGTLANWTSGEAYLTLTGGFSDSSTGDPKTDGVQLGAPAYETTLSPDGSFRVPLDAPDASVLTPLTCDGETYPLSFLALAVVSSVPQPTQYEEVLGIYTLGPSDAAPRDAVWLYSERALELNATCTLAGSSPAVVKLDLASGWNQAILIYDEQARLESALVPETYIWTQF